MGLRRAVFDPLPGRRAAADVQAAGSLQRVALDGAHGQPVADDAERLAPVGSRLPANAALVEGRRLRSHGRGSAAAVALGRGPRSGADGGNPGRPDAPKHPGEWRPSGLRWA